MKRCMRLKQNLIGHTVVLILLIRLVLKAYDDDDDYDGLLSIEQAGTKNYYATSFIQTGKHLKTTPLYIIEYKYIDSVQKGNTAVILMPLRCFEVPF